MALVAAEATCRKDSSVVDGGVMAADSRCGNVLVAASVEFGSNSLDIMEDQLSVYSAPTTIGTGSNRTARRAFLKRAKKKKTDTSHDESEEAAKTKDVATQCCLEALDSDAAALKVEIEKIRLKLGNARLRTLTWKGRYASLKRYIGADSDSAWGSEEGSRETSDGSADDSQPEEEAPLVTDELPHEALEASVLGVGDTVVIEGLTSEKGMRLNSSYAKVLAWNEGAQRFQAHVGKEKILIKPEN
eukprot:TRINITY_DN38022_c0_g1_i1.p1 TRINITY_DN38022_c0_g1~~TRINITY_DN38022_c0_g1_i1.p1  ORF type:complete len:271 (+),score=40.29 TRINITY_DN38022_c0_g1_i1:79-813(+)